MEYVGRRIKKELLGGTFYGSIESFDSSNGLFKVAYDGGCRESESLELSQLSLILEPSDQRCGIVERCGTSSGLAGKEVKFDLDLNAEIDLNDEDASCVNDHSDGCRIGMGGLDLNEGVNEVFLEHGVFLGMGEQKEIIDLNLDVNEDGFGVSRGEDSGRCFDLNLELMDDGNRTCEGQSGGEELGQSSDVILVNLDDEKGNMLTDVEIKEDGLLKDSVCGLDKGEDVAVVNVEKKRRGRKRKNLLSGNVQLATQGNVNMGVENGVAELELEAREETTVKDGGDLTYIENGNLESLSSVRRGRKRKEIVTDNQTLATPEMGLRRSARRAKRTEFSSQDQISSEAELNADINHYLPSPEISALSSEKTMVTGFRKKYSLLNDILPPKVDLPPSSRHLDLCGVPMFDLVSVYSFLRSFSTLLFLSPFELDDFLLSVKCTDSTLLFDSINVSLLRALRKHLEFLSSEGSESAHICLRSLNWDILDLVTWPMFMVEYLIMHSPGHIPGLDISQLKVYQCNYYTLPVSAKVEILQHLCDELVEAEPFISEIRDRKLAAEQRTKLDRKVRSDRKRKSLTDASTSYDIAKEVVEETTDGNADDCFLCKNDGDLICCDGCPAAYHSRCAGVISSKLPEGNWYCPECSIEKDRPWMKIGKSYCGAELLGMDPYGRRFYKSCGYLLVLESSDDQYSYWFYAKDDLHLVLRSLDTSPFMYAEIINAISKHWNVVREVGEHRSDLDTWSYSAQSAFSVKGKLRRINQSLDKNEACVEKRSDEKSMVTSELEVAQQTIEVHEIKNIEMKADNHLASSEGSAEVTQNFVRTDYLCLAKTPEVPVDHSEKSAELFAHKQIINDSRCHAQDARNIGEVPLQVSNKIEYVNYYRYAWTSSSYYEQFTSNAKNSKDGLKTVEDILDGQIKVVSNRFTEFSWANVHNSDVNAKKEKCGWCFYCRFPEAEKDCLFTMSHTFPSVEKFTSVRLGICKQQHSRNHLADLKCHLICMEEHLQGLLVGPWLDPRYSMLWRKDVIDVENLASFKDFLLKLESNLHHLALSVDWWKHVDSISTMGSAVHIIRNNAHPSAKRGSARKSTKSSDKGIPPSAEASTGLSFLWWRGGRCSRRLFNWKVLPRSLALKAARQGGGKKIAGILYPDNAEHAKRTRRDAWRAAVETSSGIDQLALQVRELDANIKWDEIGNTNSQFKLDKESIKAARSFKKAIIRRKSSEGSLMKYLLDFGKRRFIPDVVARHGTMFGDSSSEKKKFWLEELHVPLYLLKAYEEKQIARKHNKLMPILSELRESSSLVKNPVEKKGFEYLFARAERSDNCLCAHCHKDVLVREAVSCQYCKEFFHKRHARKYSGSTATECAYSCHKCEGAHFVKTGSRNGKLELINLKNTSKRLKSMLSVKGGKQKKNKRKLRSKRKKGVSSVVIPLRRSARNAERKLKLSLRSIKTGKHKRTKRSKPEQPKLKKPPGANLLKRKRKMINNRSYWLNGLKLSRREDDEEITQFRRRKLIAFPGEVSSFSDGPKCSICGELEPMSDSIYVACETCGAWFHGDALELSADKIEMLSGFKCHECLDKSPPVCPHHPLIGSNNAEIVTECKSDAE